MLEDHRAGLTIDRRHEEEDRDAGHLIRCPALILWSLRDDLEHLHGDPLEIWRRWADDVHGHGIDSGHHMAEQAPDALAASLADFFAAEPGEEPEFSLRRRSVGRRGDVVPEAATGPNVQPRRGEVR
jgi:haloacetate dehalogenase